MNFLQVVLPPTTCEWIGNDEFCNNPPMENKNYCEDHLHKIYIKGSALRKKPRKEAKSSPDIDIVEELRQAYEELLFEGTIDP